jgi:hypothetical protein
MDLLSWFVEVWFASVWFEKAQAAGEVPYDEIFMPQMIINIPGYDKQFPLWLSAPIRNKIQKLCFSGKIVDMVPSRIIGRSEEGIYRALSYIRVTKEKGIIVDTAMQAQNFPVPQVYALDELAVFQIYEKLEETLKNGEGMIPLQDIADIVNNFKEKYEMRSAFGTSSSTTKGDPLSI